MRLKAVSLFIAALVAGVTPLYAQQRDVRVQPMDVTETTQFSNDSNWRNQNFSLSGAITPTNAPTGAAASTPSCTPNWQVVSAGDCASDGTQPTQMSDGCGGARAGTQTCKPAVTGKWTYHGGPAAQCQTFNTNGFAVCYLLLQCQNPSNNQALAESSCDASTKPRWAGCAVNGYGQGTCDPVFSPRYDLWSQTGGFIQPNCNYNGFNTATGFYTRIGGVCNSTITAM